jgi:hypothetical protein
MQHDLQDLDRAISEKEIHAAVMQSASEKSPGPDGYIGAFYKVCWGHHQERSNCNDQGNI